MTTLGKKAMASLASVAEGGKMDMRSSLGQKPGAQLAAHLSTFGLSPFSSLFSRSCLSLTLPISVLFSFFLVSPSLCLSVSVSVSLYTYIYISLCFFFCAFFALFSFCFFFSLSLSMSLSLSVLYPPSIAAHPPCVRQVDHQDKT